MALLQNHLEQINLSAQSIGELEFHRSKPFTNALLHNQEITALIRDTEPHERGLFSIDPNIRHSNGQARTNAYGHDGTSRRRTTQLGNQSHSSVVVRVLGNDMLRKIQSSNRDSSRGRGVDIEVLLQSAEKLCAAFDVVGTMERVAALRDRHQEITSSIEYYKDKMSKQQQQSSSNRFDQTDNEAPVDEDELYDDKFSAEAGQKVTDDGFKVEEEAIKELEARKKTLESRVLGMEKDLGRLRD